MSGPKAIKVSAETLPQVAARRARPSARINPPPPPEMRGLRGRRGRPGAPPCDSLRNARSDAAGRAGRPLAGIPAEPASGPGSRGRSRPPASAPEPLSRRRPDRLRAPSSSDRPAPSAAGPLAGLRRAARRGRALERRPRPAASARPRRAALAAALLALPLLAVLAPSAQAQTATVSAGAVEGSDINQESPSFTLASLFVRVMPRVANVPLRNCFTSSLSTPSFRVTRGINLLTLDASGCIDLTGGGSDTTQFSFTVYGTSDTTDEPDELVTLTISEDPDNPLPAGVGIDPNANSAFVTIRDDDPTLVELARAGTGAVREGGTVEFTVTLGRDLVAGEAIDVPLSIGGTDVDTDDWSLALKTGAGLNTGVALSGETTATPQLAFSGAGARTATLTLTALLDDDVGAETLVVALGPDDATANGFDRDGLATNVGGGADPSPTANRFEVTVNDPPAPAAPAGFTATAGPGSGQVTLRWNDPGDSRITSWQYDNWRGTPGAWGGWRNFSPGAGPGATEARVSGLVNGDQYGFRVRARAGALRGAASDAATATPAANPPPLKPTGLTATPGDGRITLSWDNPADARITHWQIRVRTGGGAWSPWGPGLPPAASPASASP